MNDINFTHRFPYSLPITSDNSCKPLIYLPDSLNGKERKRIHSLCASLDLYHAGVGSGGGNGSSDNNIGTEGTTTAPSSKRRIAVSIFVNGIDFVPDQVGSEQLKSMFSSRSCRPWYYRAHSSTIIDDEIKQRKETIELEKKQIRQFANLPEKSLRISEDGEGGSFCDSLDLNVLDALDLSVVSNLAQTSWMLVDTVEKLRQCVDELTYGINNTKDDGIVRSPKIHELAFDLEMCNVGEGNSRYPTKSGTRTCLIQLTSNVATTILDEGGVSKEVEKDYIIDPLAAGLWDAIPSLLGPLFADPKIVKIGHGIGGMDTSSLHRDFGILVVNAFDTYEASAIMSPGKGGMGLATLCRHYKLPSWEHYKELKHKYQTSDWRIRPLDEGAVEYGRYDIRYLIPLRKLLMRDLAKMDILGSNFLRFGSSLDEDSGAEPMPASHQNNGDTPIMQSMESTMSTTTSSFSEMEGDTKITSNSDESPEDDDNIGTSINDGKVAPTKTIIHAPEFPCYHHLMRAISTSQKRCLKLWDGDEDEPIMRNYSLLLMIQESANGKGYGRHWSDAHMALYKQLAEWRVETARREFNSVSEVCTLDFLVHVAYKLPTSRDELRRYSYVLPSMLEDDNLPYCDELCHLVTTSDVFQHQRTKNNVTSMAVIYYSNDFFDCESNQEQTNNLSKWAMAFVVIGVTAVVVTRARKS